MLALRFLTGGALDPGTGEFRSPSGIAKYYRATDSLQSDAYRSLVPEDLVEILTVKRLGFSHGTQTGVLFHMMGAVSEFGKVGVVAIGNSRAQAESIFAKTVETLDEETRYGQGCPDPAASPRPLWAHPPAAVGERHRLQLGVHLELLEHVVDVVAHRGQPQGELPSDLLVRVPARHPLQDLLLSAG